LKFSRGSRDEQDEDGTRPSSEAAHSLILEHLINFDAVLHLRCTGCIFESEILLETDLDFFARIAFLALL
jgi:hypothetical protein